MGSRDEKDAELWHLVAALLADDVAAAVVVLDEEGRVRVMNRSMERLCGWTRELLLGSPWVDLCVSRFAQNLQSALRSCLAGSSRRFECVVDHGSAALRLRLELRTTRAVAGGRAALVARVVTTERLVAGKEEPRDFSYEVAVGARFGRLLRVVSFDGQPLAPEQEGRLCYQAFHGREAPCEGCPVLDDEAPWPRVAVLVPQDRLGVEVLRAYRLESGRVRLQVTSLSAQALASILRARVTALARDAKLSPREHAVVRELVAGLSLEDVASRLGIRARTVRFHQRNAMSKLGVTSRLDLIRLVF